MDPATLAPAAIVQVIAVWVIQKLKAAKWFPLLTQNSATVNRIVAYVTALATTAGITWNWMVNERNLVIHVPTWDTIVQALWTAAAAVIANEVTYMLVQIKQQTTSSGQALGAAPIPTPPPIPVPDKPKV
jgi:hypothetical protein